MIWRGGIFQDVDCPLCCFIANNPTYSTTDIKVKIYLTTYLWDSRLRGYYGGELYVECQWTDLNVFCIIMWLGTNYIIHYVYYVLFKQYVCVRARACSICLGTSGNFICLQRLNSWRIFLFSFCCFLQHSSFAYYTIPT